MYAIHRAYPGAAVTLLSSPGRKGSPGARELLEGAPWLNDLIVYHNEDIANHVRRRELFSELRSRKFDVWFELPTSLIRMRHIVRNMLMARAAGAGWGYGWRLSTIDFAAQAQSELFDFPTEVERLTGIVADSGITVEEVCFPLPITEFQRQRVERILRQNAFANRPLAVLAPGAKRPANRWPLDRFAQVGRHIKERNFVIAILGGPSETDLCESLANAIGGETLNLSGQLSLLESAELLRQCRFVICNDSGTQHLAAAVGTPCVSIFSRRDLKGKWWPYGLQHTIFHKEVECHTCFLDVCPYDNLCIKMISSSEVIEAVGQLVRQLPAQAKFSPAR